MIRLLAAQLLGLLLSGVAYAGEFLPPEQAFKPHVEVREARELSVTWAIADGYKLYRESMSVGAGPGFPALALPEGKREYDEALGKTVATFQKSVTGTLTLPDGTAAITLELNYQGCAIGGFCYPPQTRTFRVEPGRLGLQADVTPAEDDPARQVPTRSEASAAAQSSGGLDASELSTVQRILQAGSLPAIAGSFLLFGLLLSFTPCVLPMIPILSSIIVGQQQPTRTRGLLLATSYSLGMALVYTTLGVTAGLVGEGLAAFMQQPAVLIVFALMLVAFALSMFDVYQLQLPASWQGGVSSFSGRFGGGRYLGVFAMGAVSSLIVGPCVAGPLAGALLYISQTRDVALGGLALFSMACGMSVPLLLTGVSAGGLLPKAGAWMNHVKSVFGLLLLAVALWMINPLLGDSVRLMVWGALLVFAAFCTPLWTPRPGPEGFATRVARVAGVLALVTGLAELWGGLMGNGDLLAPLRQPIAATATSEARVRFERITRLEQLQAALRDSDRPVVLDFYADWCASCLEMERLTFRDPKVVERMRGLRVLQVDVTRNTPDDRELMRQFKLFGPPALLVFARNGEELSHLRLIGFLGAAPFAEHLDKIFNSRGI